MKTIAGSLHKSNIHVTPLLVATIKSLSFAANGDKTHAGCTKGITPFGTLWRSVEAMNEDTAKEGYFNQATLKTPADIRKHATSAKVELPTQKPSWNKPNEAFVEQAKSSKKHHGPHDQQSPAIPLGG